MGATHGKTHHLSAKNKQNYSINRHNYQRFSSREKELLHNGIVNELSDFKPAFLNPSSEFHQHLRASSPCLSYSNTLPKKSIGQNLTQSSDYRYSKEGVNFLNSRFPVEKESFNFPGNLRSNSTNIPHQQPNRFQHNKWDRDGQFNQHAESVGHTDARSLTAYERPHVEDKRAIMTNKMVCDNNMKGEIVTECDPFQYQDPEKESFITRTKFNEGFTGDIIDKVESTWTHLPGNTSMCDVMGQFIEKPPTSPSKSKKLTAKDPLSPTVIKSGSNKQHTSRSRLPTPNLGVRSQSVRSSSAPRPNTADGWARTWQQRKFPTKPLESKPNGSPVVHQDSESNSDKHSCLSRIEYTFYICDTEAYQRPFYDRRVEAIARASQCTISLHKPPSGHKSVYYKGIRVLPVTIASRTMVALKRCIARLDMQYPYFNVKAFCPPDMY